MCIARRLPIDLRLWSVSLQASAYSISKLEAVARSVIVGYRSASSIYYTLYRGFVLPSPTSSTTCRISTRTSPIGIPPASLTCATCSGCAPRVPAPWPAPKVPERRESRDSPVKGRTRRCAPRPACRAKQPHNLTPCIKTNTRFDPRTVTIYFRAHNRPKLIQNGFTRASRDRVLPTSRASPMLRSLRALR